MLKRKHVDVSFGNIDSFGFRAKELGHVETRREVAALCANYSDPVFFGTIQQCHRLGNLHHHLRAEGILLGRIVDNNLEDVPVGFRADLSRPDLCIAHLLFSAGSRCAEPGNLHQQCGRMLPAKSESL